MNGVSEQHDDNRSMSCKSGIFWKNSDKSAELKFSKTCGICTNKMRSVFVLQAVDYRAKNDPGD